MKIFSGLLMFTTIFFTSCQKQMKQENLPKLYSEQYRPQIHFSPPKNWMNDPNGMFFLDGEYHLFYQHYPDSNVWGPMHWGHAVSNDLVHWRNLPIALFPDSLGLIFSGSCVVDVNNTSGLGTKEQPPVVAIFTQHLMEGEKAGRHDFQTQGIAYSIDKGATWNMYDGNPVIKNSGKHDFRDPKVMWHEPSKQWVMILAVKDHVELYGSPDLKQWELMSDFGINYGNHKGVWECPDLFMMKDDGGKNQWVMLVSINPGGPQGGSATQYFIGDFDGKKFTPQDSITRWVDYGADNYAGVTWSNIPEKDGRRIFLGWMSNWQYAQIVPTEQWRSALTIPRILSLTNIENNLVLASNPVTELLTLKGEESSFQFTVDENFTDNGPIDLPSTPIQMNFNIELSTGSTFKIEFSNETGDRLLIGLDSTNQFYIDRTQTGLIDFSKDFTSVHYAKRLSTKNKIDINLLMDASSIELFADNGTLVMTDLIFPKTPLNHFKMVATKGNLKADLKIYTLKSIWK